jgi:hypothetical protein
MHKSAIGTALLLLALAVSAAAADNKAVVFTRSGMEEAALPWRFVDTPLTRTDARRVHWHLGYVEIKTPIGPLRILYLPLLAPLRGAPGSRNWNGTPNAFDLTNLRIPPRPEPERSTSSSIQTVSPPSRPASDVD